MTTHRRRDITGYPAGERARAFMRGIPNGEPMVSVAREGFERPGMDRDSLIGFALTVARSESCGCAEIARMMRAIASAQEAPALPETPYRSADPPPAIPDAVQDSLCRIFLERFGQAMDCIGRQIDGASDTDSAGILSGAKINSRIEKGLIAYGLLGCGAATSAQARTDLTRVFCQAARDVVLGGYVFTPDSAAFLDAVIREFGGERVRSIIPHGISRYEAERILSAVSERLCGRDVSFP